MITKDKFNKAKQCLIDNGIEPDEAIIVLLCIMLHFDR